MWIVLCIGLLLWNENDMFDMLLFIFVCGRFCLI